MTETRLCAFFPGGHAAYPQFESEENPAAAARMNDFYQALRDAARDAAASCGSGHIYSAEYKAQPAEDGLFIVYTIRLRHRGRTVAAKTITHRWRDGVLIMPRKNRRRPLSLPK